ncbi:hypothetical protein LZ32DRAFT_598106, partial [Colletotrichum eremochloae]
MRGLGIGAVFLVLCFKGGQAVSYAHEARSLAELTIAGGGKGLQGSARKDKYPKLNYNKNKREGEREKQKNKKKKSGQARRQEKGSRIISI